MNSEPEQQSRATSRFPKENPTLYEPDNQISYPITIIRADIENRLNLTAVREADGGPGCIERELREQVTGELTWVARQDQFEISDTLEGAPIKQPAAGIDRIR